MIQENVSLYRKEYFVHMTKIATGLYKNLPSEGLLLALYISPRDKRKNKEMKEHQHISTLLHTYSTSSRVTSSSSS
jgi:hypothetical protein